MIRKLLLSHNMTNPPKWVCAQRRLRSSLASIPSDQRLRSALSGNCGWPNVSSCIQQRLWSEWAKAQADMGLLMIHGYFIGFHMLLLIYTDMEYKSQKKHDTDFSIWSSSYASPGLPELLFGFQALPNPTICTNIWLLGLCFSGLAGWPPDLPQTWRTYLRCPA